MYNVSGQHVWICWPFISAAYGNHVCVYTQMYLSLSLFLSGSVSVCIKDILEEIVTSYSWRPTQPLPDLQAHMVHIKAPSLANVPHAGIFPCCDQPVLRSPFGKDVPSFSSRAFERISPGSISEPSEFTGFVFSHAESNVHCDTVKPGLMHYSHNLVELQSSKAIQPPPFKDTQSALV